MFDWVGNAINWIGDQLGGAVEDVGSAISEAVWDVMLTWLYDTIYGAVSEFFTMINGMGAGVFDLEWVNAFLTLFSYFGWALFVAGLIVAVFDTAIEYQTGRVNLQSVFLNVLKGFMAVNLFTKVHVLLYQFCVTLQGKFTDDLLKSFIGTNSTDIGATANIALSGYTGGGLLGILTIIALGYCVAKLFFANIKRGGILLCQIALGSLYMFSVPRGYSDGFTGWCKQVLVLE